MQDVVWKGHRSPAVQRLLSELAAQIRSGALRPGDYLPSAHALAAQYGVGYVSVIRAYKTLSEAGLVQTVQGRGAFVRGPQPAALTEIAVVLHSQGTLSHEGNPHSDWVFQHLLGGMNAATLARGVRLQLLFADVVADQWREVIDGLTPASGVLFVMEAPPPWVMRLHRRGLPYGVVLPLQRAAWESELPRVDADYYSGVKAAVTAALQGRRRAAFLGDASQDNHERPRYLGFRDAVRAAGAEEVALIPCMPIDRDAGRAAMAAYLAAHPTPPFELLLGGNDLRALGALDALRAHGLAVPQQIAVLGFDDMQAAAPAGLTTVRLPMRDLGEAAIHWLLDTVAPAPGALPPPLMLPCPVVRRASG